MNYNKKSGGKNIIFILYTFFGLYLLNKFFIFVTFPESVLKYDDIFSVISGILLIAGGINYLRLKTAQDAALV